MSLKHLALAAALAFGLGGAAQAAGTASPDVIAAAAELAYAKKGGKHGWKHRGRGHHYGWHRGRGHHYGWYKHRRHHGWRHRHGYYADPAYRPYAYRYRPAYSIPAYGYGSPYATGSVGVYHPGKHKGWDKEWKKAMKKEWKHHD